jgi:plastocyanin
MAQYGSPPQAWTPPTQTTPDNNSTGSGATHTVIVAPSQGVLRYVPFAVNASVGDTIKFVWGAGPHTVTKSSELTPCNKTSTAPFASGTQMVGATCKSLPLYEISSKSY